METVVKKITYILAQIIFIKISSLNAWALPACPSDPEEEWDNCVSKGAVYSDWKDNLIVTMSERGCMYDEKRYPVDNTIEVRDLSGAGDTWMASFVMKYVETSVIDTSIMFANDNATIVVQKRGVTTI